MKILHAKELKREKLKPCADNHGRTWEIQGADVEVYAVLDDGTEKKGVQRVLTAKIESKELTMTVEVGQTQDDYHAQLRGIFNAHAPGEPIVIKADEDLPEEPEPKKGRWKQR